MMGENDFHPVDVSRSWRFLYALMALAVACLGANIALRFSAVSVWDDAYFFSRYADNYRDVGVFSWNKGEAPSYGLTSLLYGAWVILLRFLGGEAPLTMWLSSLFWGIVALVGMYLVFMFPAKQSTGYRKPFLWMLMVVLAMNAPNLSIHFTSGMDTSMGMAWLAGYLYLYQRMEARPSPGKAMLQGVAGGLAWIIRPDLLIFPLILPLVRALLDRRKLGRRMAAYTVLFTTFTVLVLASLALHYFGGLLPLSFFVKSYTTYGPSLQTAYSMQGLWHLGGFLLWTIPLWMLPLFALYLSRKSFVLQMVISDVAIGMGLCVFFVYHAYFVTPIMGYHQRFLYPALPALVFLGGRSLAVVLSLMKPDVLERFSTKKVISFALVGVFALWMAGSTWLLKPANLRTNLGKMDLATAYHELGRNNWPYLPEFLYLGDKVKIAGTELGILGAMASDNLVIDMSGLHDMRTAMDGFDSDRFIQEQRPDLIFLPHPDYKEMLEALHGDPAYEVLYEEYDAQSLHTWLGVALLRDSHFYLQMADIIRHGKIVDVVNLELE